MRLWNRSAKTEREQPASVASEATAQFRPGSRSSAAIAGLGEGRAGRRRNRTRRRNSTHPNAKNNGRNDVG